MAKFIHTTILASKGEMKLMEVVSKKYVQLYKIIFRVMLMREQDTRKMIEDAENYWMGIKTLMSADVPYI
jgi:hypothetical protein